MRTLFDRLINFINISKMSVAICSPLLLKFWCNIAASRPTIYRYVLFHKKCQKYQFNFHPLLIIEYTYRVKVNFSEKIISPMLDRSPKDYIKSLPMAVKTN